MTVLVVWSSVLVLTIVTVVVGSMLVPGTVTAGCPGEEPTAAVDGKGLSTVGLTQTVEVTGMVLVTVTTIVVAVLEGQT